MKLVCIDIDGTLVTEDQQVPLSAQRAIRSLVEAGNKVLLCTGRAMPEIFPYMWDLGFHGVIAAAGAYVKIGDEVIEDFRIEEAEIIRLTNIFRDRHAMWMWQKPDEFCPGPNFFEIFTGAPDAVGTPWEDYARFVAPYMREGLPQSANKAIFVLPHGSADDVEALRSIVGSDYHLVPGSFASEHGYGGEITVVGVNKAHGLHLAADHLGIARENTVAIGDSLNDLEVMETAGLSIAMGNGHPRIRELADVVTSCVDDDGLARGLVLAGLLDS